jgi:transcriptional regulator with XRE-family HTH domain
MESTEKLGATLKLLLDPAQCLLYGSYIRASRTILNLNQEEFAQFLGVTRSTLVRLENGVAPLKKSLCEAAIDLLKTAGINSVEMDGLRNTIGVPTTLDINVNLATLMDSFKRLPRDAKAQAKLESLFGQDFVAPLKKKPLRRK